MRKHDFRIELYTPIWTGDASGRAGSGLKMSGVLGGLRRDFAMLVRQYGGRTCDYTGPAEQRCNYERNPAVCPVCAVFGCTGLQRSFKLGLDLEQVGINVPDADPLWRNRTHDNQEYRGVRGMAAIAKWLAVSAGCQKEMRHLSDREAQDFISSGVRVAYSLRDGHQAVIRMLPLTRFLEKREIDLTALFALLLDYSATYTGLGAKRQQGWGLFALKGEERPAAGAEALQKLIRLFPYNGPDNDLPDAGMAFVVEWRLSGNNLGFKWPDNGRPDDDYLAVGFALVYRLRRYIKFFETDYRRNHADDAADVLPVDEEWRQAGRKLGGAVGRCPWREAVPLVQALFGRDNAGEHNKFAGLVGVSHLFRKNDGKWYVRLHGTLPPVFKYRGVGDLSWDPAQVRNFLVKRFSELLEQSHVWQRNLPREVRIRGVQQ